MTISALEPIRTPVRPRSRPVETFLDSMRRNLANAPDALAYRFLSADGTDEESMTNTGLADLVSRYARALRNMKNPAREEALKVVILLPQGRDFVASFYGCIAAQAIAVPTFPPKNPSQAQRLKLVLLDLKECVVLADREAMHTDLADLRRDPALDRVTWEIAEDLAAEHAAPLDDFTAHPDAIAMLQYTSGSTGHPRGVMVSNRNMVENSEAIKQSFGHHRPNRRSVIWLPPYHDMGLVGGVLQPVHAAFPALLMPTSLFVRSPFRWLRAIDEFRGTSSGGPNFAFQMCVNNVRDRELARLDLSSWDVAFCGAEPINHDTMVAFSKRFAAAGFRPSALYPCYGMAETTLMVSGKHHLEDLRSLRVDAQALAAGLVNVTPQDAEGSRSLVSCGVVHPSMDLRVVDPVLGIERADREIGELWISGSSVTQGYWGQVDKTLQTYDQRLPGREGRYLRTGDLGFVDGGELFVTGRIKEVLIIRGANHYPQDIEHESAMACPEFVNCRAAAFSVPGTAHERVVLGLEVPRTAIDHEAVVKRINTRLAEKYGIRADIVLFIPRKTIKTTTSGKLQRLQLRTEYLAGALPTYHVWEDAATAVAAPARRAFSAASVDDVLHWVIDRIAALTRLEPSRIHRDDRFSDLAMDSVASLEIISELDQQHGVGIAPDALYKFNTPELLAGEIFNIVRAAQNAIQEPVHANG
jgi:acyl-CoA synthetase (AMP-forming)/AMP-acid ligase II/acyl carrier protein